MPEDKDGRPESELFEIDELDDKDLEGVAGGSSLSTNDGCTNGSCGGSSNTGGCENTTCGAEIQ